MMRPLHDLDFITASLDSIPETLGSHLLLRHVHPHDPPGKNMLQGVDPENEVREYVFRAYGLEMERTAPIEIATLALRLVSLEDLVARHARLNWDLMGADPLLRNMPEISCGLWSWFRAKGSNAFGRNIGNLRAPKALLRPSTTCAG